VALRGFHQDNTAVKLNNGINHTK